jgi:hypothetical protein
MHIFLACFFGGASGLIWQRLGRGGLEGGPERLAEDTKVEGNKSVGAPPLPLSAAASPLPTWLRGARLNGFLRRRQFQCQGMMAGIGVSSRGTPPFAARPLGRACNTTKLQTASFAAVLIG